MEDLSLTKAVSGSDFAAKMVLRDVTTGAEKAIITAVYHGLNANYLIAMSQIFDAAVAKCGSLTNLDRKAVVKAQRTFQHEFFDKLLAISEGKH